MTDEKDHAGWIGTKGQLLHALRVFGCDQDAQGNFQVDGTIVSFMGIDQGDATEIVIGPDAVFYVGLRRVPLARTLYDTSYGLKIAVIGDG